MASTDCRYEEHRVTSVEEVTESIALAEKMSDKEMVSLQELLMSQMIQLDAITQLMIEKGMITDQEFISKLNKHRRTIMKRGMPEIEKAIV